MVVTQNKLLKYQLGEKNDSDYRCLRKRDN